MAKKCDCLECKVPHPMFWGIALTIVGIIYILQDMGTSILPEGVAMWHVLVLLAGLHTLYQTMK